MLLNALFGNRAKNYRHDAPSTHPHTLLPAPQAYDEGIPIISPTHITEKLIGYETKRVKRN